MYEKVSKVTSKKNSTRSTQIERTYMKECGIIYSLDSRVSRYIQLLRLEGEHKTIMLYTDLRENLKATKK